MGTKLGRAWTEALSYYSGICLAEVSKPMILSFRVQSLIDVQDGHEYKAAACHHIWWWASDCQPALILLIVQGVVVNLMVAFM